MGIKVGGRPVIGETLEKPSDHIKWTGHPFGLARRARLVSIINRMKIISVGLGLARRCK
jgi:hypothetical protein